MSFGANVNLAGEIYPKQIGYVWDPIGMSYVVMTQPGGGTGGAGDASAANQVTEIAKLTSIDGKLPTLMSAAPASDTGQDAVPVRVISQLGAGTGGGGGGAVTIADGADATQGAKADSAWDLITGSPTVVAIVKKMATLLDAIRVSLAGTLVVSGPLTDVQLRASAIQVDVADEDTRLLGRAKLLDTGGTAIDPATKAQLPAALGANGGLKVEGIAGGVPQPVSGTVTANAGTNLNTSALALDATVAKDGTDITGASMPAGGVGIRGWLSAIYTKLAASIAVTGTFWQTTQPVSIAAAVAVTGTFFQAAQPITDNAGSLTVDAADTTFGATVTPKAASVWDISDRAARLLGRIYGSQGQQLTQTATNFNTQVEVAVGAALIDPRAIRALTNADVVKAQLQDNAGTAVTVGQKAAASSLPVVLASDASGGTQASALFIRPRKLVTYRALYRLAARPYALSSAFAAAGRKQYATIHHTAAATKLVKLRHVWVAVESTSVAALLLADLVRITTAPATGNPAITPSVLDSAAAAAEATCLALPTTAGTEAAIAAFVEWNLGITAAGTVVNPPPPVQWIDLVSLVPGFDPDDEGTLPQIRAGVLEGWAVTLDCSAIATEKAYAIIEFTEE